LARQTTLTVRLSGALNDFVQANVGEDGWYENVSEYIRDLIRRDKERTEQDAFDRLKAELAHAFAVPESSYTPLTAPRSSRATSTDPAMAIRVQEAASHRLDEIYRYTRDRWREDPAERYITGLFAPSGGSSRMARRRGRCRGISASTATSSASSGTSSIGAGSVMAIGIVTVLHERMHQIDRFREDFGL